MPASVSQPHSIFEGAAFSVVRAQVELDDSTRHEFEWVTHPGSVTLVPVGDDGKLWFVRQFRPATQQELLEFPAGTLNPGETAQACALRELREEIGMAAGQLDPIGTFFLAPGYSDEATQVYLAHALTPAPLPPDESERLVPLQLAPEQVYDRIASAEIRDGKTLAAVLLALPLIDG